MHIVAAGGRKKALPDANKLIQQALSGPDANKRVIRDLARSIAKKCEMSPETIRSRIKVALAHKNGKKAKIHGNQTLTNAQEIALVGVIKALASMAVGATYDELAQWCGDSFKVPVTRKVMRGVFAKYSKEIGTFKLSPLEPARLDNRIINRTHDFLEVAREMLKVVRADGANLINIDEAKASADDIAQAPLSGDKTAQKHGFLQPQSDHIRTLVMAVTAKGDVLVELRIFKDPANAKTNKITLGGHRVRKREKWPVFYAVTENGYMDSNLWFDLIQRVVARYTLLYVGLKPILLLDHHTTHEQYSALSYLVKQEWNVLFFPSHTTHFLQPLDNVCFARYKFEIARQVRRTTFRDALQRDITKMPVASVIGVATRDSFTKKSIKASFLNTGMHPFDESKIDASLEKYLGAASEKPALTAQEEAIRLTTNIAKEAFGASTPITKKTVRNAPAKSTMFTAEQMLAYDEERKQDAEKAKQSKSKKRKNENTQAPTAKRQKTSETTSVPREPDQVCWACGHSGRQTKGWELCEYCENVLVCTYCKKENRTYHEHVRDCGGEELDEDGASDLEADSDDE